MCGICGIVNLEGRHINEEVIHNMCTALVHRGPDDEGIHTSTKSKPSAGLGHRRLKIIDLTEAGRQPMCNEDGSLWLVLNGEIYNYPQLRKGLKDKGHQFRSNTDVEVVLHLYEDFAENCLSYLRGMFAFAIWDEKKGKLFFARDRLGQKPLLYYCDSHHLCFASEFSALFASGLIDRNINYEAMDQYLTFGYVPAPATIYKEILKMLPGHYGIFQDGKLHLKKYWDLDYSHKITISEEDAAQELIKRLKEAVGMRLVSDVPLGVFLSGGLDSSAITALMSQLTNKVKTFSIGFEEADFNELKFARTIAIRFSTDHREFTVKPKALEVLPLLVERYGEPYADSSALPTFYVAKETRRYVTVALNGDGGDESFAGYDRYQAMVLAHSYNHLPSFLRDGLRRASMSLIPEGLNFKKRRKRLRRFLENASLPFFSRYCNWVCIMNDTEKNKLYSEDFKGQLGESKPADWLRDYASLPGDIELIDRLMAIDIKTNLANDLLVKMDIASMANSLETRSPFLDHKLMEFVARLPAEYKMKKLIKKYLLKKAIKDLIPKGNLHRRKMGFAVPVGEWFRTDLKDFLYEILLSESSISRGYFKPEVIENMLNQHIEKRADYTFQLWALLMLELWHKRFID
jgi:asparagine synthase (glutamine-hydrolysing)